MTNGNIKRANLVGEIVERIKEHHDIADDFKMLANIDFANHEETETIATAVIEKRPNHLTPTIRFKNVDCEHTEDIEEILKYIQKHTYIYEEE